MKITSEEIKHLASLSDISLSEEETSSLEGDLAHIIDYISTLDELDTTGVDPTYQVFEMKNVFRTDELEKNPVPRDALLSLTREEKDHQIKVKKVL